MATDEISDEQAYFLGESLLGEKVTVGSGRSGEPLYGTFRVDPDGQLTRLPELAVEDLARVTGIDVDAFMERMEAVAEDAGVPPLGGPVDRITSPLWSALIFVEECLVEFEIGVGKGWRHVARWWV